MNCWYMFYFMLTNKYRSTFILCYMNINKYIISILQFRLIKPFFFIVWRKYKPAFQNIDKLWNQTSYGMPNRCECMEASRGSTLELRNCFRGKFTMKILLTPEGLKNIVNFDHGRSHYLSYRSMGVNFKTR